MDDELEELLEELRVNSQTLSLNVLKFLENISYLQNFAIKYSHKDLKINEKDREEIMESIANLNQLLRFLESGVTYLDKVVGKIKDICNESYLSIETLLFMNKNFEKEMEGYIHAIIILRYLPKELLKILENIPKEVDDDFILDLLKIVRRNDEKIFDMMRIIDSKYFSEEFQYIFKEKFGFYPKSFGTKNKKLSGNEKYIKIMGMDILYT